MGLSLDDDQSGSFLSLTTAPSPCKYHFLLRAMAIDNQDCIVPITEEMPKKEQLRFDDLQRLIAASSDCSARSTFAVSDLSESYGEFARWHAACLLCTSELRTYRE